MWMCCHPLADRGYEDQMITRHATSVDGLHWRDHGVVLRGTPGGWDARGARITAILDEAPLTVLYDGRATAAVALPNGRTRFYFEAARPDGSHDLMTCM